MKLPGRKAADMSESNTIPEATYRLRVNKFEFKTPKDATLMGKDSDGNEDYRDKDGKRKWPYFSADLVVQDEGEFFGRHVFDSYISTEPGDDWKLRMYWVAAELDPNEDFDSDQLLEAELYGVITLNKEGKGKDGKWYPAQNRVGRVIGLNDIDKLQGTGRENG